MNTPVCNPPEVTGAEKEVPEHLIFNSTVFLLLTPEWDPDSMQEDTLLWGNLSSPENI